MPKLGCIAEITNNFSWLIQTYGLFLRSETQKTPKFKRIMQQE